MNMQADGLILLMTAAVNLLTLRLRVSHTVASLDIISFIYLFSLIHLDDGRRLSLIFFIIRVRVLIHLGQELLRCAAELEIEPCQLVVTDTTLI